MVIFFLMKFIKELAEKVKLEGITEKQNWLSEYDQEKIT